MSTNSTADVLKASRSLALSRSWLASSSSRILKALLRERRLLLLDLGLVVTAILMVITPYVVFFFHIIFVLLTGGAFSWGFRAFVVRAVTWVTITTVVISSAVLAAETQAEEIIEIPLLSAILMLVFAIARQRAKAEDALRRYNASLEDRVAQRTKEIDTQRARTQMLLRRYLTAQEEQRAHLSRELHDGIGQSLTAVEMSLDHLAMHLPAEESSARKRIDQARRMSELAIDDLRGIIADLRPGVLDKFGLVPALGWLGEHSLRPLGIDVTIEADALKKRLPSEIETILFRISQEAICNVARHSQATHLLIRFQYEGDQVQMILIDNGCGFDESQLSPVHDVGHRLGLAGMQERAALAGGGVTVESARESGTTVKVVIPVHWGDRDGKP